MPSRLNNVPSRRILFPREVLPVREGDPDAFDISELVELIHEEAAKYRWNFDFANEAPMAGDWQWEHMENAAAIAQMPVLQRIPLMAAARAEAMERARALQEQELAREPAVPGPVVPEPVELLDPVPVYVQVQAVPPQPRVPGRVPIQEQARAPIRAPGRVQAAPGRVPARAPARVPARAPVRAPARAPAGVPARVPVQDRARAGAPVLGNARGNEPAPASN